MPVRASTGPVLARTTGPVLAHNGMFKGNIDKMQSKTGKMCPSNGLLIVEEITEK